MDNKKILLTVLAILVTISVGILLYFMFRPEEETYEFAPEKQELINPNTEEIVAPFVDRKYIRQVNNQTEIITFGSDGTYSYQYDNDTPVGSTKTCEYYTYNNETEIINLVCFSKDDIITELKIVSATDTTLQIDFYGDIRMFERVIGE